MDFDLKAAARALSQEHKSLQARERERRNQRESSRRAATEARERSERRREVQRIREAEENDRQERERQRARESQRGVYFESDAYRVTADASERLVASCAERGLRRFADKCCADERLRGELLDSQGAIKNGAVIL